MRETAQPSQILRLRYLEVERDEAVTIRVEELALELHPVQSQRVKERGKRLHDHQHAKSGGNEHVTSNDQEYHLLAALDFHFGDAHEYLIVEHSG